MDESSAMGKLLQFILEKLQFPVIVTICTSPPSLPEVLDTGLVYSMHLSTVAQPSGPFPKWK